MNEFEQGEQTLVYCSHAQIRRWTSIITSEEVYECAFCHKKIFIPFHEYLSSDNDTLRSRVMESFGIPEKYKGAYYNLDK